MRLSGARVWRLAVVSAKPATNPAGIMSTCPQKLCCCLFREFLSQRDGVYSYNRYFCYDNVTVVPCTFSRGARLFTWPSLHTLSPVGLSLSSGVFRDFAVVHRTSSIRLSSNTPAPLLQAGLPWRRGAGWPDPPGSPTPGGDRRPGLQNPSAQPAAS